MGRGCWRNYMASVSDVESLLTPRLFPERRRGLCTQNTPEDRSRRKERARELTRINMEKKGQMK